METGGLLRPQIYEDATGIVNDHGAPWRAHISGAAFAGAVSYTAVSITKSASSRCTFLPIKGTSQVTFKSRRGTEPTLPMPMLVANGHRLFYRGEDTIEGITKYCWSEGNKCGKLLLRAMLVWMT